LNEEARRRAFSRTAPLTERLRTMRIALSRIHRWIGLIAGAYFALAGLTGVVLLYRAELDTWLNRDLKGPSRPAFEGQAFRPIDDLFAAAKERAPLDSNPAFIHLPKSDDGYFDLIYSRPNARIAMPLSVRLSSTPIRES
jgi:uncharacterized iron-regulated membrane protein